MPSKNVTLKLKSDRFFTLTSISQASIISLVKKSLLELVLCTFLVVQSDDQGLKISGLFLGFSSPSLLVERQRWWPNHQCDDTCLRVELLKSKPFIRELENGCCSRATNKISRIIKQVFCVITQSLKQRLGKLDSHHHQNSKTLVFHQKYCHF